LTFNPEHATTTAYIDLTQFAHNIRTILDFLGSTRLLAVVKANGYGHGINGLIPVFARFPKVWLGVPTLDEALELRSGGAPNPILILSHISPVRLPLAAANSCRLTVHNLEHINWYKRAAQALPEPVRLHLKVDTGMSRLGIKPDELDRAIDAIASEPMFQLEGFWSHLVESSIPGDKHNELQQSRFEELLAKVKNKFPSLSCVHLANSGGTLNFRDMHYDMVRAGILCYGLYPPGYRGPKLDIAPILSLKAQIHDIRVIPRGMGVSYGHVWLAPRETTVITVPIGYADGWHRSMTGRAELLYKGTRCPVIGAITMDYLMADVTGLEPPSLGEEVTLIGRDGGEEITADEVAQWAGTIVYEITCGLGRRIKRVYQ